MIMVVNYITILNPTRYNPCAPSYAPQYTIGWSNPKIEGPSSITITKLCVGTFGGTHNELRHCHVVLHNVPSLIAWKQHHEGQPLEYPQPCTPLVPMQLVYPCHLQPHHPPLVIVGLDTSKWITPSTLAISQKCREKYGHKTTIHKMLIWLSMKGTTWLEILQWSLIWNLAHHSFACKPTKVSPTPYHATPPFTSLSWALTKCQGRGPSHAKAHN